MLSLTKPPSTPQRGGEEIHFIEKKEAHGRDRGEKSRKERTKTKKYW